MRISELAKMLNVPSKNLLVELDQLRPQLVEQGLILPEALKPANRLEEETISHILAIYDARKLDAIKVDQEQKDRQKREVQERELRENQEKQRHIEEERRKQEGEQRRIADIELLKKQQEVAATQTASQPAKEAVQPGAAQPAAPPALASQAPPADQAPRIAQQPHPSHPSHTPHGQRQGAGDAHGGRERGPSGHPSSQGAHPPGQQQRTGPHSAQQHRGREFDGSSGAAQPPSIATQDTRRGPKPPDAPPRRPRGDERDRGGKPREKDKTNKASKQGIQDLIKWAKEATTFTTPPVADDDESTESGAGRKRRPGGKAVPGVDRAGKRFRPTKILTMDDMPARVGAKSVRPRPRYGDRDARRSYAPSTPPPAPRPIEPKVVRMTGDFTLAEFAERTGISGSDLIGKLLLMGEMVTINQLMNPDLAELLAQEFNVRVEIARESNELDIETFLEPDLPETLLPRPPVITVMGHVDHGKTTLLDAIRKTNVAEGEFGGITQHIGAYTVATPKGPVTFLDTPGHEAFTAMRARGANMTDVVVLVVAANDGIMPQTIEAINHAKAANVPIVVAINKIDVPGANGMRIKQDLMKYELVPEELGGSTICIEVSAKKRVGIDSLLDLLALQAEVLELKADPNRPAIGTVVEAHVDPQRGARATLLVQRGTLHAGEIILAGDEVGRVRAMNDDHGQPVETAGPSTPIEVIGLAGAPAAGETFLAMKDEALAREIAERRRMRKRRRGLAQRAQTHVTLENLGKHIEAGRVKDLHIVLKTDVQGSLEAIQAKIYSLPSDKVRPSVIHSGVGAIGVSDVDLADASDAVVIGFNTQVDVQARELAEQTGVEIKVYRIIFELLDELRRAMLGMLDIQYKESIVGKAEVRQVFRSGKFGNVAGCFVESGVIIRGNKIHVRRGGDVVFTGSLGSLRRVKDDVKQVQSGLECGIAVEGFSSLKEGDILESFTLEALAPEL